MSYEIEGLDDVVGSKKPSSVSFYMPGGSGKVEKLNEEINFDKLDPDMRERIMAAKEDWESNKTLNPKGLPFPLTSAARSRALQENLYKRSLAGEQGIYMPENPAKSPDKQWFHTNSVDISSSVPDTFLKTYGLHRPFGSKDPVHVQINPEYKWEKPLKDVSISESGDISIPGLEHVIADEVLPTKEELGAYQGNPMLARQGERSRATLGGQPGAVEKLVTDIAKPVSEMSFADWEKKSILANALKYGTSKIPFVSLQMTPEQAGVAKESEQFLMDKGRNALSAIASPIETGKNVIKGLANASAGELIGEAIKGTVYDPELLALGGPTQKLMEKGVTSAGKVGTALADITPTGVKNVVGDVLGNVKRVENKLDKWNADFNARRQAAYEAGLITEKGMPNVGAAMAPDIATVKASLALASPDIQQLYGHLPPEKINLEALNRHSVADKWGINLTKGEATQDPALLGREWNLRGTSKELMERLNERSGKLYESLNTVRDKVAPDLTGFDIKDFGQTVIDDILVKDKIRLDNINAAYKALNDANGGKFPIDVTKLDTNIAESLSKQMKTNHLPDSIKRDLQDFYKNPTFESYEAFRTNLAQEMRSNSNGNARAAAYVVRNELEKLPMPDNLKAIKPLADEARKLVTERSNILKTNPAYRNAVKDTRDIGELTSGLEHVGSDKFIEKFVFGNTDTASRANIQRLLKEVGNDSRGAQAIRAGTIEKLKQSSKMLDEKKDSFSQKGYRTAIEKNLGSKLNSIMDPVTVNDLKEIGDLASWTEHVKPVSTAAPSGTPAAIFQEFGVPAAKKYAAVKSGGMSEMADFALGHIKRKFETKDILKRGSGIEKD